MNATEMTYVFPNGNRRHYRGGDDRSCSQKSADRMSNDPDSTHEPCQLCTARAAR